MWQGVVFDRRTAFKKTETSMWVPELLFGLRGEMLTKLTLNIFPKGTISSTEKNVFKNVWQIKSSPLRALRCLY